MSVYLASTTADLTLRGATLQDARLLLEWRNDLVTRASSFNSQVIQTEEHARWLTRRIAAGPEKKTFVAAVGGVPVGTIRLDDDGAAIELSWCIGAEHRRKGYGFAMVAKAIAGLTVPLVANIKRDNESSIKIARRLGFVKKETQGMFIRYEREEVPPGSGTST